MRKILSIRDYIEKKFPHKLLIKQNCKKSLWFYENQKAEAINGYYSIKKYLNKKKRILEVGGGIQFLSNYLAYLKYSIISLEPGGFRKEIDLIRNRALRLKESNLIIKNISLENFAKTSNLKFDFIYSINVLEHVKDISKHLNTQENFLKDQMSVAHIRCPNYTFPFESHVYLFFIPFFPKETFKFFYEKKLIKKYGIKHYFSIMNSLNFSCSYFNIKKIGLNITFTSPITEIYLRINRDPVFRARILINTIIKVFYYFTKFFQIQKLISLLFPKFLSPYLIFNLKKK
jgi:2-polyprenyl-3-methyl-5-hydroxy-6-metoxy-1,4-benzoquinol methylase